MERELFEITDKMYGLQPPPASDYYAMTTSPESLMLPAPYQSFYGGDHSHHNRTPFFGSDELISAASAISSAACGRRSDESHNDVIKARIVSHPFYPKLLEAYIDCQKVGAPPEIARILDEIRRENDGYGRNSASTCLGSDPELDEFMVGAPPEIARILDEMRRENDGYGRDSVYTCLGSDPELDEFMESFYDILVKYKSDLARPFDEASEFLNKVENQLRNLCKEPDEGGVSSDKEYSTGGEIDGQEARTSSEDWELKERLLRKYGNQMSSLKLEFSEKKKKGTLPKEARQTLLAWWNLHYKWPYPTGRDKISLAELTGLDQKQIHNWFVNQRRRHWKPSENMHLAVMSNLSGQFYMDD